MKKNNQKVIYLSGPITGMPQNNVPQFEAAKKHLQEQGYDVINPLDIPDTQDLHPTRDYERIMRIDVAEMCLRADEVVTLAGWENSPGANREVNIARLMNIPVQPITKYMPSPAVH